jgi:endo-1,4-beta-xylanase
VKGAKGKVTYKVSGNRKSKKALKFNKKTRKITVRKGTKKGLYKLKIRVNCAGTEKYLAASKKVTVKVRVK